MLKFLQYRSEVEDLIVELSKSATLKSFKVGFTGSFANGENKDSSPIDVILKLKDGEDKKQIGSMNIAYYINSYMHDIYSNKVKIIWYDLLEKNEVDMKKYQADGGIEGNPSSPFLNIANNIVWADSLVSQDEDEDEEEEPSETEHSEESESDFIKTFKIDAEDDSDYEEDEEDEE